jgi:hypothetical protein
MLRASDQPVIATESLYALRVAPAFCAPTSIEGASADSRAQILLCDGWAFVCNIGDCLMRWSNDVYVSTPHKVVSPPGADRYSVAFFLDPNPDAMRTGWSLKSAQ